MNVIFISCNLNGITLQIFTDSTYIIVKIAFDLVVSQIFSVFCTEYDMRVDFGERLWHRNGLSGLRPFRAFIYAKCTRHSALHYVTDFAHFGASTFVDIIINTYL